MNGKEQLAALGIYPGVALQQARTARDAIQGQLRLGRDPSIERLCRGEEDPLADFRCEERWQDFAARPTAS